MNKEVEKEQLYHSLLSLNSANLQISKKYYKKAVSYLKKQQRITRSIDEKNSYMRSRSDSKERKLQTSLICQKQNDNANKDILKTEPSVPGVPDVESVESVAVVIDGWGKFQEQKKLRKIVKNKLLRNQNNRTDNIRDNENSFSVQKQFEDQRDKTEKNDGALKAKNRYDGKKNWKFQSHKALLNLKEIVFVTEPKKSSKPAHNSSYDNLTNFRSKNLHHREFSNRQSANSNSQSTQAPKNSERKEEGKHFLPQIRKIKELKINNSSSLIINDMANRSEKKIFNIEAIPLQQIDWHGRQV